MLRQSLSKFHQKVIYVHDLKVRSGSACWPVALRSCMRMPLLRENLVDFVDSTYLVVVLLVVTTAK